MDRPEISRQQVCRQLRDLGVVPGAVLVVHTSFRAVRPVEDGPGGLIAALRQAIGPDGTLVMPTMSGSAQDDAYDAATPPTHDGIVADSFARLARSRDVVAVVTEHLAKNPTIFLCPRGTGCDECDSAWQSIVA